MKRNLWIVCILLVIGIFILGYYAEDWLLVFNTRPWTGCAYHLDCCPTSGEGLCYLEEDRIQRGCFPACPRGLAPRSLILECLSQKVIPWK